MAIEVVHTAQTGSTATGTLTISSATKGHILVAAVAQAEEVQPTFADNISGSTGWTVYATYAGYGGGAGRSVWVAVKESVGGETEIKVTGTGTKDGVACCELKGAGTTIDVSVTSSVESLASLSSKSFTLTHSEDIVLGFVGLSAASGVVKKWTGTGPLTNFVEAEPPSTYCFGGYYLPAKTLSAVTFTANWSVNRNAGMLVVAIKAVTSESVTCEDTIASISSSVTVGTAMSRTCEDTVAPISSEATGLTAASRTASDTVASISSEASALTTVSRTCADTVASISSEANAATAASRTCSDTVSLSSEAAATSTASRTASDSVSLTSEVAASTSASRTASDNVSLSSEVSGSTFATRTCSDTLEVTSTAYIYTRESLPARFWAKVTLAPQFYASVTSTQLYAKVEGAPQFYAEVSE